MTWFATMEWGCDRCRQMFPPTMGRVRAQVVCEGPNPGTAYVGDLWLESDRLAFAATARAGARSWGFVLSMLFGMALGSRRAARGIGGVVWDYRPSFEKRGSIVIAGHEIVGVARLGVRTWELRLGPNPQQLQRLLIQLFNERPMERLLRLVPPRSLPPSPPARWPLTVPSALELVGFGIALVAAVNAEGLAYRVSRGDDERTFILVTGVLAVLCGVRSLVGLRRTTPSLRWLRIGIALLLLLLGGIAAGNALYLFAHPPR